MTVGVFVWQASDAAAREQLERVVEVLVTERCKTLEDCIEWARKKFQASSDAGRRCIESLSSSVLSCMA